MTDFQMFETLYNKIGVDFTVDDSYEDTPTVTLDANSSKNLIGYTGFTTTLRFNTEGDFLSQDIFE